MTLWIRRAKREHSGPPKAQKTVPEGKTHRKSCPEGAQKRPSAQHGRAKLREASKTQQNVITEGRVPRKYKTDRPKLKYHLCFSRCVCVPNLQKTKDLLHGNTDVSTMFKSIRVDAKRTRICARSSPPNGGPSSNFRYTHLYVLSFSGCPKAFPHISSFYPRPLAMVVFLLASGCLSR